MECKDCRFFVQMTERPNGYPEHWSLPGKCHCLPLKVDTSPDDWCGKFEGEIMPTYLGKAVIDWYVNCYEPLLTEEPQAIHWAAKSLADAAREIMEC